LNATSALRRRARPRKCSSCIIAERAASRSTPHCSISMQSQIACRRHSNMQGDTSGRRFRWKGSLKQRVLALGNSAAVPGGNRSPSGQGDQKTSAWCPPAHARTGAPRSIIANGTGFGDRGGCAAASFALQPDAASNQKLGPTSRFVLKCTSLRA
jgi:hypothetical protein